MIGLLSSSYPSHEGDYRGHFVRELALALAREREVVVVTPRLGPGMRRRLAATDPAVVEIGTTGQLFGRAGIPANLRRRPWAIRELPPALVDAAAWLQSHSADLTAVVAHWLMPFGLLAAAVRAGRFPFGGASAVRASRPRWPLWILGHSGGVHALASLPAPARRWVGDVLASGADRLTFVTPGLLSRFLDVVGPRARRRLAEKSGVLSMGVDVSRFERCRPDPDGPIAVVGRLARLKGVDRVLRGVAALDAPTGRRTVRLIGDGPERQPLVRLARRLGVRLDLLGEVPTHDLPKHLDGTAMLAVPSRRGRRGRHEGLPVSLLEGLASGLPALVAESWPVPRDLAGASGVALAPDHDRGYADALRKALAAPPGNLLDERQVERRRELVRSRYDWDVVGQRACAIVAELGPAGY